MDRAWHPERSEQPLCPDDQADVRCTRDDILNAVLQGMVVNFLKINCLEDPVPFPGARRDAPERCPRRPGEP